MRWWHFPPQGWRASLELHLTSLSRTSYHGKEGIRFAQSEREEFFYGNQHCLCTLPGRCCSLGLRWRPTSLSRGRHCRTDRGKRTLYTQCCLDRAAEI